MQFGNWKKLINKFVKNNNDKKEKPEELQDPSSTAPSSTSTELLQPSQEIARENVIYNNDGTTRLFPTNKNGSYFILGKQNPNNLKNFTTDSHNEFVKKKEGNIEYWSVLSGNITYKSTGEHAKSCRLNIFASTTKQTNDWKAAMKSGFIGNENDLKNQEVTAIIRVHKRLAARLYVVLKCVEVDITELCQIKQLVYNLMFQPEIQDMLQGGPKSYLILYTSTRI